MTWIFSRGGPVDVESLIDGSEVSGPLCGKRVTIVSMESVVAYDIFDTEYRDIDGGKGRVEFEVDRVDGIEGLALSWIKDGLLCAYG